jgi:hypothetical protein
MEPPPSTKLFARTATSQPSPESVEKWMARPAPVPRRRAQSRAPGHASSMSSCVAVNRLSTTSTFAM